MDQILHDVKSVKWNKEELTCFPKLNKKVLKT